MSEREAQSGGSPGCRAPEARRVAYSRRVQGAAPAPCGESDKCTECDKDHTGLAGA